MHIKTRIFTGTHRQEHTTLTPRQRKYRCKSRLSQIKMLKKTFLKTKTHLDVNNYSNTHGYEDIYKHIHTHTSTHTSIHTKITNSSYKVRATRKQRKQFKKQKQLIFNNTHRHTPIITYKDKHTQMHTKHTHTDTDKNPNWLTHIHMCLYTQIHTHIKM